MLIAFRAIQGLGAGSIFTVAYTIVGDVFTLEERSKVQGGISTVWGIASLACLFLGGFLIDTLSWHWIFFINIPFGILSIVLLQKSLKEPFEKKKHKIDIAGTMTFTAAMVIFLNLFLSNTQTFMSHYVFVILSVGISILLLFLFYIIEKKAAEPIFPLDIFTRTSIIMNIISFLGSIILIGLSVYMPIYIQNVLGFNATISGLVIAPMSVSWLISSFILGKWIIKLGSKVIIIISSTVLMVSMILMATLNAHSSLLLVMIFAFISGFGFSGTFTTLIIALQSSVQYRQKGAATAANSLLRTLGQTIGVSILGVIFNLLIIKYFRAAGFNGIDPGNLYTSAANLNITSEQIKLSQSSSINYLFIIFVAIALFNIILTVITPKIVHNEADSFKTKEENL